MHRLLVLVTNHAAKQLTHALEIKLRSAGAFRTEAGADRLGAIRSCSPNPTDISNSGLEAVDVGPSQRLSRTFVARHPAT